MLPQPRRANAACDHDMEPSAQRPANSTQSQHTEEQSPEWNAAKNYTIRPNLWNSFCATTKGRRSSSERLDLHALDSIP